MADKDQKRSTTSTIKPGDRVLVKYPKGSKSQAIFDPKPFEVTQRFGNRIFLRRYGKTLVRPLNHLKRVTQNVMVQDKRTNDTWIPLESQYPQQTSNDSLEMDRGGNSGCQSPNRVQRPAGLRNTIDVGQFRQRVLGQGQANNQQPVSPPDQIYTGSGRLSRPVVGQRLIDEMNHT